MSYVAIRPAGEVTPEMRKAFVRLALDTEPRGTSFWSVVGEGQALLRGSGSIHQEGRYLLRSVAKNWEGGALHCSSISAKESTNLQVYYCTTELGVYFSTSRLALSKLLPGVEIVLWSSDYSTRLDGTIDMLGAEVAL